MKASKTEAPAAAKVLWNSAASGWDAGFDWYAGCIRPLTGWFCSSVASPGARVLDIACGSGLPALAVAERVGARGRVVATDIAPAMVEVTRRRARESALENLEVLEILGTIFLAVEPIITVPGLSLHVIPTELAPLEIPI